MKRNPMFRVYRARPLTKAEFYWHGCQCNCVHVEVACVPWRWLAALIMLLTRNSFIVFDERTEEGAYDDSFDHMLKTTFPNNTAKPL